MNLAKLRGIAQECRTNPNYHFRTLSDAEFTNMAATSFGKLTDAQKIKVTASWFKTATDKETC